IASMLGWVDHPDQYRKIHQRPVPRLGGIGIYIAFLVPLILLYFIRPEHVFLVRLHDRTRALTGILIGATIALGMGVA
ncbi:hypothetical protein, partial [Klebsiella pneumoniae]|uniref:hypothetical protein n=1 Tax=Klebsiella pneumoniae TaxID=573 RepID=UPI002731020A